MNAIIPQSTELQCLPCEKKDVSSTISAHMASPNLAGSSTAVWLSAMKNFETARKAEEAFDRDVWMPAFNASRAGGAKLPNHIEGRMTFLTDARCDAEDTLLATPSPALSALIWKMEHAHKRWEDFEGWPDDWWSAVMSDLHRFAAKES